MWVACAGERSVGAGRLGLVRVVQFASFQVLKRCHLRISATALLKAAVRCSVSHGCFGLTPVIRCTWHEQLLRAVSDGEPGQMRPGRSRRRMAASRPNEPWSARAEAAIAPLSSRTFPALIRVLTEWPLVAAPMAEALTLVGAWHRTRPFDISRPPDSVSHQLFTLILRDQQFTTSFLFTKG